MNDYYVYVYIDPRNFEEFYFGKGKGSQKDAHLFAESDSEKSRRISSIRKEGLNPIIRVIVRNLSEHDALLVEKTLLWKLGKHLTNVSTGHYSNNFRPHNSLHVQLSGFDFQNGIYYYNVGEGRPRERNWDDYVEFGFISGGGGVRWRDAMLGFRPGDVVAAYLKSHGFVGIGQIRESARPIKEVMIGGKPLLNCKLRGGGMARNADSNELSEYVALVDWKRTTDRTQAKWKSNKGLYTTTHVRASLDRQPETVAFLEREFEIDLRELIS